MAIVKIKLSQIASDLFTTLSLVNPKCSKAAIRFELAVIAENLDKEAIIARVISKVLLGIFEVRNLVINRQGDIEKSSQAFMILEELHKDLKRLAEGSICLETDIGVDQAQKDYPIGIAGVITASCKLNILDWTGAKLAACNYWDQQHAKKQAHA